RSCPNSRAVFEEAGAWPAAISKASASSWASSGTSPPRVSRSGDLDTAGCRTPLPRPMQPDPDRGVPHERLIRRESECQGDCPDDRELPEGVARDLVDVDLEQANEWHVHQ